jgi:hypothetical protein
MNELKFTMELKVTGGPEFREKGALYCEGYDKIDFCVPKKGSRLINVQPGGLDDVDVLYIKRTDEPPPPPPPQPPQSAGNAPNDKKEEKKCPVVEPESELHYVIGNGEQIPLRDLHIVMGRGAIKLLCQKPDELCFTNTGDRHADVTIFICRRASESCEPHEEGQNGGGAPSEQEDQVKDKEQTGPQRQEPVDRGNRPEPDPKDETYRECD